ncbi:hypothetical protein [Youngiibacter multivorans]|nr:hypothetical protein [Youngiibacter multivorans]
MEDKAYILDRELIGNLGGAKKDDRCGTPRNHNQGNGKEQIHINR